MKKAIFALLTLTLLFLAGCGEEPIINEPIDKPNTVYDSNECTDEQKQAEICTMDYTPTCGDDGNTYGNACSGCASGNIDTYTMGECEVPLINKVWDINGCYAPDGYSYDYDIQACINTTEFTNEQKQAITLAVEHIGPQYAIAVVDVIAYKCEGCFDVELEIGEERTRTRVALSNWEVRQVIDHPEPITLTSTECEANNGYILETEYVDTCEQGEINIGEVSDQSVCCVVIETAQAEGRYYCSQYNKEIDVYCLDYYEAVCGYDKDNNQIKSFSNDCYACVNQDVLYKIKGECAEEIEYDITIANHDSEQEIEIEISVDNTLLQTVIVEPEDNSVGIPSIEVLTISIPTNTLELTATELNSGFSETLTLDHNGGNYIKISYGIPGSVAQGKYITIYQLDEQVMYD
jgi:hypothetical protein